MKNLTGKCLNDFNIFLYTKYPNNLISENCGYNYGMFERDLEHLTYILPENMNNALIIEFFDSVGIYISTSALKMFYKDPIFKCKIEFVTEVIECGDLYFKTRLEATNEAILKANQLYNEL